MYPVAHFRDTKGWFPLFRRSGGFGTATCNWDDIQNWVEHGSTVSIRKATDEELKAIEPELEKARALAR